MKKEIFTFLALISSVGGAQNQRGWVVGKDYLAFWNGAAEIQVDNTIAPESWGFESASCHLWITEKKSQTLQGYLPGDFSPFAKTPYKGRIVSDVDARQLVTLNEATSQIEKRAAEGNVVGSYAFNEPLQLSRVRSSGGQTWGLFLNADENRIWLRHFDENFQGTKDLAVATPKVIWGNPRFLISPESSNLWVGYSSSGATAPYTPIIKTLNSQGKALHEYSFKEKGLFFDFCLEGDGVLMARDIPTAPYTVPVYSFLEELSGGGAKKAVYSAATNDFIDSLGCTQHTVWMAQRSIFGSEGSYLVSWKKGDPSSGTVTHKLPGSVNQLYLCQ